MTEENPFISLRLGKSTDTDAKTVEVRREDICADEINVLTYFAKEVQDKYSWETRYPYIQVDVLDDDKKPTGEKREETREEWALRVNEQLEVQYKRLPDESSEDYLKRKHEVDMKHHISNITKDMLLKISKAFNLDIKESDYGRTNPKKAQAFVAEILEEAGIRYSDTFRG
jgi:hypothetical protein